jgi:protein gp37
MHQAPQHTYQILTKRAERMRDWTTSVPQEFVAQPQIWLGVSVEDRKYGVPRIDALREVPALIRFLSVEPLLEDLGELDLSGIHWVIVGGESGRGARPMAEDWVLSVLEQCRQAHVPFFFKQWGGVQKSRHGRSLRGQTYDEMPIRPAAPKMRRVARRQAPVHLAVMG